MSRNFRFFSTPFFHWFEKIGHAMLVMLTPIALSIRGGFMASVAQLYHLLQEIATGDGVSLFFIGLRASYRRAEGCGL